MLCKSFLTDFTHWDRTDCHYSRVDIGERERDGGRREQGKEGEILREETFEKHGRGRDR